MTSTPAKTRWMPTSLRRPFLFSVATLFLLIAIAIESLRQYSKHNHGLVHLKSYTLLGQFTSGMYTYAPTAFAVIAAALWNVCALDVLRLEPYYQLANPEGAPGTMLFTNYSFFYGIIAPIMAIRNKHWIVACVSSMGLILRMLLPSLLSGLIDLDMTNIISWHPVNIWPNVVSLEAQNTQLAGETARPHNGSETTLHTYFFYGNSDYAIPPISTPSHWMSHHDSTWELQHPIYWADLACSTTTLYDLIPHDQTIANSTVSAQDTPTELTWNIRNIHLQNPAGVTSSSKCSANLSVSGSVPTTDGPHQIRHWEPLSVDNSSGTSILNHTGCAAFSLLGVTFDFNTSSLQNISSTATVFGCSSKYLHSTANVVLPSNTSFATVNNISLVRTPLTSKEFSATGFQSLLFAKYLKNDLAPTGSNSPYLLPGLTSSTGLDGAAIDAQIPVSIANYQREIIGLWKQQFALSMNNFFDTSANPKHVYAKQTTDKIIFGVDSDSAIIAEAIFLAAFAVLVSLALIYRRRPHFLHGDPGSIAAQCALVTDVFASTAPITQSETEFSKTTPREFRRLGKTMSCRWIDGPDGKQIAIMPFEKADSSRWWSLPTRKGRRTRRLPRPHFLKPTWFLIECALIAGVITAFGISVNYIRVDKFDYDFSTGVTILYLYLIYGPTVIASVISTLFTSVHRHLCHIEPWVHLREGMASAGQSLTTKYSSHTPVTIWKHFRLNKPILLMILSSVCLLDFILIIASSGMFQPIVYHWNDTTTDLSAQYYDSRFLNPDVRLELHGYNFVQDILTSDNLLLSWTSFNTSFIPYTIDAVDEGIVDWMMYTVRTRGIGVDLYCSKISSAPSSTHSGAYNWTYQPRDDSANTNCTVTFERATDGHHSFNSSVYLAAPEGENASCQRSIAVIDYGAPASSTSGSSPNGFHCEPQIHIQDHEILLGPSGLIKFHRPVPGTAITSGAMFQNATDALVTFTQAFIHQLDWPSILTKQFYDTFEDRNATQSWSTDASNIQLRAIRSIYQSAFSLHTSMWRHMYLDLLPPSTAPTTINATLAEAEWGIVPSNTVLLIMIVLLSIDFCVLMAVFLLRYRYYNGPSTPQSIGSLIPWVAQSRMLSEFKGTSTWSEEERRAHLEALGRRYRFGEFDDTPVPGRSSRRVALDWDNDQAEIERDEEYEMVDGPILSYSVEKSGPEITVAAAGSESALVNTDTTAHTYEM
ncbi:hypothetical protein N7523_010731 [Penicillium sp. IBT 18751x]|nr:hypothetical protein N7523_010731 [Penicillium sp. IBT 18751x]